MFLFLFVSTVQVLDDQEEESSGEEVEVEKPAPKPAQQKKADQNKRKAEDAQTPKQPEAKKAKTEAQKPTPAAEKKEQKKAGAESAKATPAAADKKGAAASAKQTPAPESAEKAPKKKTLPSGLTIEDKVVGSGAKAKNGKHLALRYIGKLASGKVFDSNTSGQPFKMQLGKGSVIKGWEVGLQDMKAGGTRVLTIPPNLAYGELSSAVVVAEMSFN